MSIVVVTGTGTGVGKTVATAALACQARMAGIEVAVCKPVQTGTDPAFGAVDDDLAEIGRLARVNDRFGRWRYPEPLAPVTAAHRAGLPLPTRTELRAFVEELNAPERLTLVEGAGGLLVELGVDGVTLRDLAADLSAPVLVVTSVALGTLNHTALTLESLARHDVTCAGLVIGAWPAQPGPAETTNWDALARLAPLRAVLPAGAGSMSAQDFETLCGTTFDRRWMTALV